MVMKQYEFFARSPTESSIDSKIRPFELNKEGKRGGEGYALVLRYAGCNLRCPLCYAWRYAWFPNREGYTYSLDHVLKALDNLYSLNVQRKINWVRIQGGEPCLSLDRTLLTLKACGKALQVIQEIGLNRYPSTRAVIQTNGIFFSTLNNNEKAISLIREELKKSLRDSGRGRIIFELSFKDPTGKREWDSSRILEKQLTGFKTLLKVVKPLWDENFNNVALYVVAGLGPSIDFHNVAVVPIDPYSLPKEYPLFHPRTWSNDFSSLYDMFINNVVPHFEAYRDFRNNPKTGNGRKVPLEEFEPNKFQKAWLSGYANKYQEYGLKVGVDIPSLSNVLRRLDPSLSDALRGLDKGYSQWNGLCEQSKKWRDLLDSIPLAHNSHELLELIKEMNEKFYPSHPDGHYPYL